VGIQTVDRVSDLVTGNAMEPSEAEEIRNSMMFHREISKTSMKTFHSAAPNIAVSASIFLAVLQQKWYRAMSVKKQTERRISRVYRPMNLRYLRHADNTEKRSRTL
jgi:hypothetical protein